MCWIHQRNELLNPLNVMYCFRGTRGFPVVSWHFGLQLALLFSTGERLTVSTRARSLSKNPWIDQPVFLLPLGGDMLEGWGRGDDSHEHFIYWNSNLNGASNHEKRIVFKQIRENECASVWWEHTPNMWCCFASFLPFSLEIETIYQDLLIHVADELWQH